MPFNTFVGNRRIVDRLQSKLREGRFPHGLIFSGPEGIGKRTLAFGIAKALNCIKAGPADFCDTCAQCHKVDSRTHPDLTFVTVEEEASEIKIAQIRRVLQMLDFQPMEGKTKVFVIDPANQMKGAAANALLKGLEEPPVESVFILLTANVHDLPITIRSRCQVYHFSPLMRDEIRKHGVADELVVRWSQGSIGRALSLDVVALRHQREQLLDFLETAASAGDSELCDMLGASANISKSKQDFPSYLSTLTVLLGDLMYLDAGLSEQIVNSDIQPRLEKLSETLGVERVIALAGFVSTIEANMKHYVNRQMMTDVLALNARSLSGKNSG